jgi:hypothetical protein
MRSSDDEFWVLAMSPPYDDRFEVPQEAGRTMLKIVPEGVISVSVRSYL